jgi:hypothetical protein
MNKVHKHNSINKYNDVQWLSRSVQLNNSEVWSRHPSRRPFCVVRCAVIAS